MSTTQLFIIDRELGRSVTADEINATVEGLKALDLYHLPYPKITIQVLADEIVSIRQPDGTYKRLCDMPPDMHLGPTTSFLVELTDTSHGRAWIESPIHTWLSTGNHKFYLDDLEEGKVVDIEKCATSLRDFLITLLATRNIVKSTTKNKCAALGLARKRPPDQRYAYVTRLSLPTDVEDDPDHIPATGSSKRSHLRRGHIRHQRHGPKLQFQRRIWIEPMFINADENFISSRRAYNLCGGHHHDQV